MDMATAPDEFPTQSVPGSGGGLPDAGRPVAPPSLFQSFWMGGFESSYHINRHGLRVDMQAVTQHDIRGRLVDRGGSYDFSSFAPMLEAARGEGAQIIWDLCHYGWPEDVSLFSAA